VKSELRDSEARHCDSEQAMTESDNAHKYLLSRPPVVESMATWLFATLPDSKAIKLRKSSLAGQEGRACDAPPRNQCLDVDIIPTGWYGSFMSSPPVERSPSGGARSKLLDAAFSIIREKGYTATSVDELCAQAGVTKGAFFHHFKSKDALGVAAAHHWSEITGAFFETAPYHEHSDPLERVLGYLDFRKAILKGEIAEFTCLVGTMVQEIYGTNPDIRVACEASISTHAAKVQSDIADAMRLYGIRAPWTAEGLALHMQAVLQGAFVLAKAKGNAAVVEASIDHLHRYVELLFCRPKENAGRKSRKN
jgi:TetR/AcrR family transcriptional repressor of nem operon